MVIFGSPDLPPLIQSCPVLVILVKYTTLTLLQLMMQNICLDIYMQTDEFKDDANLVKPLI